VTTRRSRWYRLRLLPIVIVVIIAALSAIGIRHLRKAEARRKREGTYQTALRLYSHDLKPGLTRVYVAIEFAAVVPHDWHLAVIPRKSNESKNTYVAYDSDILTKVEIYRPDTGCL